MKEDFNPLPPHGGRRPPICNIFSDPVFQSTPSTRRETYWISVTLLESFSFQSTPSTRRETDRPAAAFFPIQYFNPLPPHGGRRAPSVCSFTWLIFQSTPSTRRETLVRCIPLRTGKISIHSLHTEGDIMPIVIFFFSPAFQSTPSTRRETVL